MNDAEYEALREKVLALFTKWRQSLGLSWWKVTYEWHREHASTEPKGNPCSTVQWDTACVTAADWRYMDATIKIYLPCLSDQDDEKLEHIVVHELCHLLVNEARAGDQSNYIDHEERVTETIARAFLWVRDEALELPYLLPGEADA